MLEEIPCPELDHLAALLATSILVWLEKINA
jgi:hypothetical protein